MTPVFSEDLRLPERGLLLHIGPHKTGTTSIQGALRIARPRLPEHGVVYAGKTRQHQMAALSLTGAKGLAGDRPADESDWRTLVTDVHDALDKRVIVSSEFFDDANDEVARRVVDELGGDRVHVLVTLRPLAKIVPSAWQQYVRNRLRYSYDEWLDAMFNQAPYDQPTPTFWQRHRHADIVERWASIVGPERLLVVVVDESDPESLMRTFERIVDLPDGFLKPETGRTNRSLTAAETELVRALNIELHRRKWPLEIYHHVVRRGVVRQMQLRDPGPGEPGISTPQWALDRANEIAADAAKRIEATGVHVLGDMSTLSAVRPKPTAQEVPLDQVQLTIETARRAVTGAIATGIKYATPDPPAAPPRGRDVDRLGSRDLARIISGRVRKRLSRRR
jgi:hypothetical protein